MWETVISWYLNNYLGKYVENLNSQQLSFALRQGELELENVPLKKNIFRSWGLPVEVRSGVVGRIKIEFNLFKYLRNEPVLITIEDIYLVAGPLNLNEWDPVLEEAVAHEAKMSSLDSQEARWKTQFDMAANSSSYYSSLYFSSMRIGASIVTKVVENLHLSVTNVHIRFEEEIGCRNRVFAFGLTLESLTAQSCDAKWNPLSSAPGDGTERSFKTLQLNKFDIYCDTKGERLSGVSPKDLRAAMCKGALNHEFVLFPVSSEARIVKNNSPHPLSSSSQPRFDVQLNLENFQVQLTDSQYRNVVRAYKSYLKLSRNCRLRHYRPFVPVLKNSSEWWNYAFQAVLLIRGYKRRKVLKTWDEVLQRAKDNIAYVNAYEQHLLRDLQASDIGRIKDRMEMELHYEEILALREVAMRRVEDRNEKYQQQNSSFKKEKSVEKDGDTGVTPAEPVGGSGGSLFSYYFPSISNWISGPGQTSTTVADNDVPSPEFDKNNLDVRAKEDEFLDEKLQLRKSESEFDEAILDDVKAFGRDTLLARFKFVLRQGVVNLNRKTGPFLELDVGTVGIQAELKPRSGSHKFKMTLASLSLKDCCTKSIIISPRAANNTSQGVTSGANKKDVTPEPIFNLLYERKPYRKVGHRASITTRPLDLVIYPVLWENIGFYFHMEEDRDELAVSQNSYEAMKQKTKEELRIHWERLINMRGNDGLGGDSSQNWDINLDISAPQIVIYDSKQFDNRMNNELIQRHPAIKRRSQQESSIERFVVLDLGRFRFTNTNCDKGETGAKTTQVDGFNAEVGQGEEDDENEEFLTPCSSPAENVSYSSSPRHSVPDIGQHLRSPGLDDGLERNDSFGELQAKLYKKYLLEVNDVQVIVVEGKAAKNGNWKLATSRGVSTLHLVDRFSINLQFERRLIFSDDPRWPYLALVATLPKLNLHFSESKILTVQSVFNSFLSTKPEPEPIVDPIKLARHARSGSQLTLDDTILEGNSSHVFSRYLSQDQSGRNLRGKDSPNSDSKLFLAQFTIQQITVEIQSRGRSIAELQISGARTTYTKRIGYTSISFVIHSLLLADAVQTFGADFELLLASHRHVCMDSVSGSLKDSEPTSPMSPQSPASPIPFAHDKLLDSQLSIPSQLHEALLSSLQSKRKKSNSSLGIQSPVYEQDALITAELMIIPDSNGEDLVVLSVQFNNLDVIANQETMVEIAQFIQNVSPSTSTGDRGQATSNLTSKAPETSVLLSPGSGRKIDATFDFNRLSVLLLRGAVGKDGSHCARKIATATVSDAKFSIGIGGDALEIKGSLGGLQVLNLTPEGQHHQRTLSVGKDPLVDAATYNVFTPARSLNNSIGVSNNSALDFSYVEPRFDVGLSSPVFTMRVASVIYTHCPVFLIDLQKCISQFQAPIANKLKSAAAQIALGLVRQDGGYGFGNIRSPIGSLSTSLDRLNVTDEEMQGGFAGADTTIIPVNPGIKLDIVLDSPVLVLPRNRTSSEVLVANLGQITIKGCKGGEPDETLETDEFNMSDARVSSHVQPRTLRSTNPDAVHYSALICDVSLYALNLQERWNMISNLKMTYPTTNNTTLMRAQELYYCDPAVAKSILHNTVIQFNFTYVEDPPHDLTPPPTNFEERQICGPKLEIQGSVVNPLKVSLTPQQYSQVLDSINNIAAGEDDFYQKEVNVNTIERRLHWEREISSHDHKLSDPLPLPSPTVAIDDSLQILALFEIPELIVELVFPDEVVNAKSNNDIEIPHLSLSCSEFSFDCEKAGHITEMRICLKSLILQDTSVGLEHPQRVLAFSKPNEGSVQQRNHNLSSMFYRDRYISTSCPDLPKTNPVGISPPSQERSYFNHSFNVARTESSSLPDHLNPNDIFSGRFFPPGLANRKGTRARRMSAKAPENVRQINEHRPDRPESCPLTPPPSPRPFTNNLDNLVQIQMRLIDQKSPLFITKYKGTHKFTDVEFNALEVLLTPNTFVRLRRFFSDASESGGSSKIESRQRKVTKSQMLSKGKLHVHGQKENLSMDQTPPTEQQNSETQINVKALRVKLARAKGTLAVAEVVDVMCHLVNRENDFFSVDGRLGSLEIKDVSRHAGLYPIKFAFQGKRALDFDYSRREREATFRLEMASVVCVHTNRFYTEITHLCSALFGESLKPDFQQHGGGQGSTPLIRTPSQEKVNVRLSLNIQAGAPVLLFPYSSASNLLLVADLGHLCVRNKFVEESTTIVLDYTLIDLIEMDLYSAVLRNCSLDYQRENSGHCWRLDDNLVVEKVGDSPSLLKEKCALNLKMKRMVSGVTASQLPTSSVQGMLTTVFVTLDAEKYKLIRGLLEYNIGEKIETTIHSISPTKHRRPSFVNAKPGPVPASQLDLSIELDLVNVTVELVKEDGSKLSRIDFLKSQFKFLSNMDGTKDFGLVSHKILISDIRHNGANSMASKNVFTSILQQTSSSTIGQLTEGEMAHSTTQMQAEVNFRQTQRGLSVTIVLSNIRLMLILDWWMEIHGFIFKQPMPPSTILPDSGTEGSKFDINSASPLLSRSKQLTSPVTVSAGIVTRRAPVLDVPATTFDLKINVCNCELVVVEEPSVWDTNAIILKVTAAMTYRPHLERPISCNILQSELFSCILGLESDTALSILDPTSITIELVRKTKQEPQGILDATLSPSLVDKILKIQSPQLSLRLSYYDMKMFVQLLESFTEQAKSQLVSSGVGDGIDLDERDINSPLPLGIYQRSYYFDEASVEQLLAMGFPRRESEAALHQCDGRLEDAALLLSGNNSSFTGERSSSPESDSGNSEKHSQKSQTKNVQTRNNDTSSDIGFICGIEVKCNCLSLCVIDDCKDADVPLVELNVNQLELIQNCEENSGRAECIFGGDYYNRELSGWEPFLEPWKCTTTWKRNELGQLGKSSPTKEFPLKASELELTLASRDVLNLNITSTLVNLYSTVSSNWTEDYQNQKVDKRRTPFIPFMLRNETGSPLWFSTILSNNEDLIRQQNQGGGMRRDGTSWIKVSNSAEQSFSFEGRGKLRHRNTHQLRTHQLVIRVDGWLEANPVSVDRVGTYFRALRPATNSSSYYGIHGSELPTARLVFDVRLQGSAQKLVIIRSALMVKNLLPDPVELKLENTIIYPAFAKAQTGGSLIIQVQSMETCPIPLHSVYAQIWVRPLKTQPLLPNSSLYNYCVQPLLLSSNPDGLRTCSSLVLAVGNQIQPYRFCVAVNRDEFPADGDEPDLGSASNISQLLKMGFSKRANLLTLFSPLTIVNLLPQEVTMEIKDQYSDIIPPGQKHYVTNVDVNESVEIIFKTESATQTTPIVVSYASPAFPARLKFIDSLKRILYLSARVDRGEGGRIILYLYSPYWIINKSGLPIVCKQEGMKLEAACQFREHEVARMISPLLFAFSDPSDTSPTAISLRVGNGLHGETARPSWSRSFHPQNGIDVRRLNVTLSHAQPEIVYLIGVEVKDGRGRYRDSKLITLAPRFIVDNRSKHQIQISQRNFATSFMDPAADATHLNLPSECNLPFHWPRLDKDLLLCVRIISVRGCLWSGGFPIETVNSFHINIRDFEGNCYFLKVEILLQGPTYFVIFSDTDNLPPPFRIDNLSLVLIYFHQSSVGDGRLKLTAKAESCCPYAWDEPTQPQHFTVETPGGTSIIANMEILGFISHVTYENFFYIALTASFPKDGSGLAREGLESMNLVLDVPHGSKVTLAKKEPGKRSQLWRVTADGLIEHEGSSSPRDPKKPSQPGTMLVLDIAGQAPLPYQYTHLMLRKADPRRAHTQHWEFTRDGRLKCASLENLYVQAMDGFSNSNISSNISSKASVKAKPVFGAWQLWNEVALGPQELVCYTRTESGIPVEQAIGRQKLRPGSGRLSIEVDTDGPTRVLRIIDTENPPRSLMLCHIVEENIVNTIPKMGIAIDLHSGVGVSVINCNPREELLYIRLSSLQLNWRDTQESETVELSVQNLQIDNQLLDSEKTVAIYVTPPARYDTSEESLLQLPALKLDWRRLKSKLNAQVFKHWKLFIKPLSIILEEKILFKLCAWFGIGKNLESETEFEVQKALTSGASLTAKRWYFGFLEILLNQVRLTVLTQSVKLSPDLVLIKRRLGLRRMIQFEEALIELDPFQKMHPFEAFEFYVDSLLKHYKSEFASQSLIVLGTVDFLGNPIGFVNDVSVGVSGLIHEGSFGALFKNVTHGLSNSAAKMTGSLGDGLGRTLTLDVKHEDERRKIREEFSNSSGEQLYAGLKGLGHGVIGGLTSIISQTYDGVSTDGFSGLITGLGKGIVGTVTKPAIGVLDLASGAASAIRDSSRTSSKIVPRRLRRTRVIAGNGGLLPPYSETSAVGQESLFEINEKDHSELFIGCETFKSNGQDLKVLVSSLNIILLSPGKASSLLLTIPLRELISCSCQEVKEKRPNSVHPAKTIAVEFVRQLPESHGGILKPQVIVDSEQVAKRVVQQVNYAKVRFEELRHSQIFKPQSPMDE